MQTIRAEGVAELGADAYDKEKALKPTWLLRGLLEDKFLQGAKKVLDDRVKAYAYVVAETVQVNFFAATIGTHRKKRAQVGSWIDLDFAAQAYTRLAPYDKPNAVFKALEAAAIKRAASRDGAESGAAKRSR